MLLATRTILSRSTPTTTTTTAACGHSLTTVTRMMMNPARCCGVVAAVSHGRPSASETAIPMMTKRGMAFQKSFHIDTPENNLSTHFDFTAENYVRVYHILGKYPDRYKRAAMIPLLDLAQRQHGGWLPLAAMHKVAQICECDPARVYEVASFYTMFNRSPVGRYFLQLCGTTPCMICGSEDIKGAIREHIGIGNGQTTPDKMFTLLEVECLGACANAPMLQLNDDYYECLTRDTVKQLLDACKAGKPPPMGKWGSLPMNGQVSCEGPRGKTSLSTIAAPAVDAKRFADGKVDPASVKKHMAY